MVTISRREKVRKAVGYSFLYLFLIALGAVFVFPYVFMISRGLMTAQRAEDVIMHFFPDRVMFSNYIHAFADGGYGMPLVHSLWLSALNAFAVPFSSLLAAYAFTRLNWIGKKFIFAFMLGTVMLPGVVTQVPLYVMYNDFGMLNTYLPLFLPNLLFGGAMNVFLARQFMLSQPAEVFESASIDGAGPFRSFVTIAMPLSKTIVIYLAVSVFMGVWGDYYTPSIYLKQVESAMRPFAYALYRNLWSDENLYHPEYIFSACTILSLVPTLCYAFFQKYLVQGISTVGLKG